MTFPHTGPPVVAHVRARGSGRGDEPQHHAIEQLPELVHVIELGYSGSIFLLDGPASRVHVGVLVLAGDLVSETVERLLHTSSLYAPGPGTIVFPFGDVTERPSGLVMASAIESRETG